MMIKVTKAMRHSVLILLAFVAAGCSMFSDNKATALFLIDQGAARFIEAESDPEKRAERAADTRDAIEPVLLAVNNESATVDDLERILFAQFDMGDLEPSDQKLIRFLVADVKASLSDGVVGGVLDAETKLFVRDILETILMTAATYGI